LRHPRAPSAAENFHERAPVRGAAEISELAETFNNMAGDIRKVISRASSRLPRKIANSSWAPSACSAAAIDEKDPYTRGHSDRVAKYSLMIGQQLHLSPEELDRLRIAALLHDVGKIGGGRSRPQKARRMTRKNLKS